MAFRYFGKNIKGFSAICGNDYGRKVFYTLEDDITADNLIDELEKALAVHRQNEIEIDYLDRYYKGDQPILYRKKEVRPEVNNKIALNLAKWIVDTKVANMCAEPIQYILRNTDEEKASQIVDLNIMMDSEDKQDCDVNIFLWRSICGTAYRFIGNDEGNGSLLDESVFCLSSEDPRQTFVAYYASNKKPAFSCSIRKNSNDGTVFYVYTNREWFLTDGKTIIDRGLNGNKAVPIIEYPNNERRISDIEITIGITDAINTLQSDRVNGVEQFVSSWIKFVNCDVDKDSFLAMRQEGALAVRSNNGENKADVDILSRELNQSQGQVVFDDLFERILDIQGIPSRTGNTGGDTGQAVSLRNGHTASLMRAMIDEPIVKKSERQMLRIILNRLRIDKQFTLVPTDIEVQINHNRLDNLLVKSEALEILIRTGIDFRRAIKTVDLFNDPELVANESIKQMERIALNSQNSNNDGSVEANANNA